MAETLNTFVKMIDDLGSQAMFVENDEADLNRFAEALATLAASAEKDGYPDLAHDVFDLSCHASNGDSLRQGLLQLQKALAESSAKASAPKVAAAPEVTQLGQDPELLRDFIMESRDHLATIEAKILIVEQSTNDTEAVHAIFRGFHTIKGLAGFLDLGAMQSVAHEIETVLDLVRNGHLTVTSNMVDVILAGADYLKTDISRLEAELGGEAPKPSASNEALIARVHELMPGANAAPGSPAALQVAEVKVAEAASVKTRAPVPEKEVVASASVELTPAPVVEAPAKENKPAPPRTPEVKAPETKSAEAKAPESSMVKVDTGKLDFLVDMVGELVIAQSMLRHDGELNSAATQLQRNLSQLSRITGEVQKTAMSMRMVPVGQLFQRSLRLVRDLTRKSGKRAEVEIQGEDTELDRTIVEDLSDPMIHMIRNAADHGIEGPEERVRAGKSPVARISLKAYHQAGHIVIEISDDGRGLMREKILKKAKERKLVQDGSNLSDKEVFNLIFEPGFSTAEKVTDISGRGVGMDVVRKQIQKMRGRIDIESQTGVGTTFYLKLPLTLAIIDGLVVRVGSERYIVPIYSVKEIFRPQADMMFTVEGRNEMVLVRGTLMPVVRLYKRFGIEPQSHDITQSVLVVAETGGRCFSLVVDDLIGKQEVVIKSLGETFKGVAGVAGGAILGDGRVGLILDMESVFERNHDV